MKNNQIIWIALMLSVLITGCSNNNKVHSYKTVNKEPKYVIKNSYILKDYYLVDNKNCINKSCGKVIIFYKGDYSTRKCLVIDFDNKKYKIEYSRPYKKGNYIDYGNEKFYIMQDIYDKNRFNFKHVNDARYTKNEYYRVDKFYNSDWALNYLRYSGNGREADYKMLDYLEKNGFKKEYRRKSNWGLINNSSNKQASQIITKFITKNNLAHCLGGKIVSKEWNPIPGNNSLSVTGKGKVSIKNGNKSVYINGVFNNNSISSGTLKLSQRYNDGSFSVFGKRHYKTIQLSANQNLKTAIEGGFRELANEINSIKQRKANSSSVSSSPNYPHCGANDTCYQTVKIEDRRATIKCIKGLYTGSEKCISVNKSGDWATGCGFSDMAAHHYTFSKAANGACGQ